MNIAYFNSTAAVTDQVLVSAVSGKVIRVVQLLLAAYPAIKVQFTSDPGGAGETVLLPDLQCGSGRAFLLRLGRRLAISTARGKALGVTAGFYVTAGDYSIVAWYEVVE